MLLSNKEAMGDHKAHSSAATAPPQTIQRPPTDIPCQQHQGTHAYLPLHPDNVCLSPTSASSTVGHTSCHLLFENNQPQGLATWMPIQLRPDSVVSYPEGSPLLAPHVLAAVDARLREAARRQAQDGCQRPTFRQPPTFIPTSSTASSSCSAHHSNGAVAARTPFAFPPPFGHKSNRVVTHQNFFEYNEQIKTREDLYDVLNGDSDDDQTEAVVAHHTMGIGQTSDYQPATADPSGNDLYLGWPRPCFWKLSRTSSSLSSSSSSSSSRPSSHYSTVMSSLGLISSSHPPHQLPPPPTAMTKSDSSSSSFLHQSRRRHNESQRALDSVQTSPLATELSTLPPFPQSTGDTFTRGNRAGRNQAQRFDPLAEKSEWLQRKAKADRRWRFFCYSIGIFVFFSITAGIALGFVTHTDALNGLATPGGANSKTPGGQSRPPITEYAPDPNLRKAFYGVAYNPAKAIMPWCGATLQQIVDDMILLSQITKRVRLYGMDCQQADLVLQAIKALQAPMEVVLTLWVDKNDTTYQRQYDTLLQVLDTHGTELIKGVSVGNEVIFRGDKTVAELTTLMKSLRMDLEKRYGKKVPVFTSEVGQHLSSRLAAASDVLQGNIHPFFSGTPANLSAQWTFDQYDALLDHKGVISEVGWPTAPSTWVYQKGSKPGVAELQTFIDKFICQANRLGVPYYWFEFRDELWKHHHDVPVEPYWGLFDAKSRLKVKIPDCIAP